MLLDRDPMNKSSSDGILDRESESLIRTLEAQERVRENHRASVETVLVILSSRGMAFDMKALTEMIQLSYPDTERGGPAGVFFRTTQGKTIGIEAPDRVDLLIDFTGPGQKQPWFYAKKLHSTARFRVGRNALLFRKSLYDRVFDEKANAAELPQDLLARERFVQRKVLELAGVAVLPRGEVLPDQSKDISIRLPSLQKTIETAQAQRSK